MEGKLSASESGVFGACVSNATGFGLCQDVGFESFQFRIRELRATELSGTNVFLSFYFGSRLLESRLILLKNGKFQINSVFVFFCSDPPSRDSVLKIIYMCHTVDIDTRQPVKDGINNKCRSNRNLDSVKERRCKALV